MATKTHLNVHGKIAAAQIAFYLPIALCTIYLVFYYAFRRDAGWLFLFIFSAARIADGALTIASQSLPTKIGLSIAAYTLQAAGLGILLLSTIGFIGLAGQSTYSELSRMSTIFRMSGVVTVVGIAISVAGGVLGGHLHSNQEHVGLILRRVSAGIFAVMYVVLVLVHLGCWTYHYQLRSYRRRLLGGLTLALPFLGVRVAYAILSAWSSSDLFGASPSANPTLAKFRPVATNWVPYLVMSLIMEYVVVVIYLLFSTVLAKRHR